MLVFQEPWPAASHGWEVLVPRELGQVSSGSPVLMLFPFSCLCTPEGGTPGTPEVEWRKRERTGGEVGGRGSEGSEGVEREGLERGKLINCLIFGLRLPANLEPTPTPSRNKRASARLSVRVRNF